MRQNRLVVTFSMCNVWQRCQRIATGVKGLSSLAENSKYRMWDKTISKILWRLIYFVGIVFTVLLVIASFQRYLSNPYVTKMERKNAYSSPFPSVTICNPNRIHCKHLYNRIKVCQKVWICSDLMKTTYYPITTMKS